MLSNLVKKIIVYLFFIVNSYIMFVLFYKNTIGYFYKTKVAEKNGELLFIGVGFLLLLFCILKKFVKNNEIKHDKLLIILSAIFLL